ncbi:hypothetical protein RF11_04987 [Thelohanellus kitauei]|uniref:Uncharacterized protein n=1 Tax=Thelohanellus kitauei TaxID=669202 RepID=A0A0C2N5S3_THEKT|nr:hypothetical protein RF11_04987 [Thelohanellus kitauei]
MGGECKHSCFDILKNIIVKATYQISFHCDIPLLLSTDVLPYVSLAVFLHRLLEGIGRRNPYASKFLDEHQKNRLTNMVRRKFQLIAHNQGLVPFIIFKEISFPSMPIGYDDEECF